MMSIGSGASCARDFPDWPRAIANVDRAVGARALAPDGANGVALGEKENDLGAARLGHHDRSASEAALQFSSSVRSQSFGRRFL